VKKLALVERRLATPTPFWLRKIIWCGVPKIGKTSVVMGLLEDMLCLAFERRHADVDGSIEDIYEWTEFLSWLEKLKKNKGHRMVTLDTLSSMWQMYLKWFLIDRNVKNEADLDFGRGFTDLKRGFCNALFELQQTGRGYIIQTHMAERMVGKNMVIQPCYPHDKHGDIRLALMSQCDAIWYQGYSTEKVASTDPKDDTKSVVVVRALFTGKTEETPDIEINSGFKMRKKITLPEGDIALSAARILAHYNKANGVAQPQPKTESEAKTA